MKDLDYKIIATGSRGNAVRIANIMVDCGIPFKQMKEELYKCDTLLITHSHTDHVKPKTLQAIRTTFPRITIIGNYDVAQRFSIDKVIAQKAFHIRRGNVEIVPTYGTHDVPVTMYAMDFDGTKVFYATDTSEVHNPTEWKFDYIFLEANYDPKKLEEIGKQYKSGTYDPTLSALRHLSYLDSRAFYYGNRKDKESVYIELHQSERFR